MLILADTQDFNTGIGKEKSLIYKSFHIPFLQQTSGFRIVPWHV